MASPRESSGSIGLTLHKIETPAAVLDLAKVEANCQRMLDAVDNLGFLWRAHVKTHKTNELTKLQVGDEAYRTSPVHVVVSTVGEAENLLPLLQDYQRRGRKVNMLFGFPLYPSAVPRLTQISAQLGEGGLSVLLDHVDQLDLLAEFKIRSGSHAPHVFLKIDVGSQRAGVRFTRETVDRLFPKLLAAEEAGKCVIAGIYGHAGHSYHSHDQAQARDYLISELQGLRPVAAALRNLTPESSLIVSLGSTPTVLAMQSLPPTTKGQFGLATAQGQGASSFPMSDALLTTTAEAIRQSTARGQAPTRLDSLRSIDFEIWSEVNQIRALGFQIELHAGVYPMLDLQQLATHACELDGLGPHNMALSILAEVASVYPGRGLQGQSEALVNVGVLSLGREPVRDMTEVDGADSYKGWGILMPWNGLERQPMPGPIFPNMCGGWQVDRISQEHGILAWKVAHNNFPLRGYQGQIPQIPLKVGQRVRVWPNHACIAGAGFNKYYAVDSRRKGKEDQIIDVWWRFPA